MKNLALLLCVNASIPKFGDEDVHLAVDSDTGRIYFNSTADIVGVDPSVDEETFAIGLEELNDGDVSVTGMQFLQGEESLCVSTKSGDLLLINVMSKSVEVVGSVESGLNAMQWSPDQEMLLLATGHNTIIAMTREFDPVTEVNIHAKEFGEGEFINVGWGKKETQFHGTEGKGAAVKKAEEIEPALPLDDKKYRIVWRGDGQNFAVSMIDPENGNRIFKVWNRECILQYTSEYMNGLESVFAWKPSGNLIASSQRKPHRHDIVFFEKNGLQHGEFTLPFQKNEMKVNFLEWNTDSTVLVIWLTPLQQGSADSPSQPDCVQLWTMSNYHWYLKQSLRFDVEQRPVHVQWDIEHSHKLHVLCRNGQYKQFVFTKVINGSNAPVLCEKETKIEINGAEEKLEQLSFVAVIDGKNVLMTPFKIMTVPPPMCAYKLQLPSEANCVVFCSSNYKSSDVAIIMKNDEVAVFSIQKTESEKDNVTNLSTKVDGAGGNGFHPQVTPQSPKALLTIDKDCDDSIVIPALHHWIWLSTSQMLAISPGTFPGTDFVVLFDIDLSKSKLSVKKSAQIDGSVLSAHLHSSDSAVLQLTDGTLLTCAIPSLDVTPYLLPSGKELRLPRPCLQVVSCSFNNESCIVGLSEHSRLYINETEVASDCSSFCLHDDFLFLTTHAHQLRCIGRNIPLQEILKYYSTPAEGRSLLQNLNVVETHRALERGSKIVTVTPSDSRLVLQMPRGNLEMIHPRCLVLSFVTRLIKSLQYGEAFTVMKKHRINMNLLYDADAQLFEANVSRFISELSSTTNLNIFIGGLQDEDLTETMYKQYFISKNTENSSPSSFFSSKGNQICDILIKELEKDEKRYITSLVTSHVKKKPSEVGQALKRIKVLADSIGHEEKLISDVLKYMTVLVDSNTLFNEALGTYDFKLVLMVAEKSQLDPKEFLPMLRELQQIEENYRKYKIDLKLRRYSSALEHISKCENHFDECLQLIQKHEMYREAVKLFKEGSERHNTVYQSYGEFLASKHKYAEAGIMYLRCQEVKKALECFSNSRNYSLALSTAYKLKLEQGEIVELARKLSEKAKNNGHHSEAVEILEYHAHDIETAVETALHAQMWGKSIRIAEQYQRTDLVETHVIPAIKEAHDATCSTLRSHKDLIVKHSARLQTVRQLKEKQRMQALLDGVEGVGLDSDLYSDTSSTMVGSVTSRASSTASRSTGRTAKSRKKKERKMFSLKEGSKFEDLALLHSLKGTIKAVDDLSDDVRALVLHLSLLRFGDLAESLQLLYEEVRETVSLHIPLVWSTSLLNNEYVATGPQSTVNSIVASMQNQRTMQPDSGEEKQDFADLDLFVPPKFGDISSWKMNLYFK